MKRGDIYFIDLGKNNNSEQSGMRPVVVVQNNVGNAFSSTVIVACITASQTKAHLPTHVEIDYLLPKKSTIMLEQLLTVDRKRLFHYQGTCSAKTIKEINSALKISLSIN